VLLRQPASAHHLISSASAYWEGAADCSSVGRGQAFPSMGRSSAGDAADAGADTPQPAQPGDAFPSLGEAAPRPRAAPRRSAALPQHPAVAPPCTAPGFC